MCMFMCLCVYTYVCVCVHVRTCAYENKIIKNYRCIQTASFTIDILNYSSAVSNLLFKTIFKKKHSYKQINVDIEKWGNFVFLLEIICI